MTALTERRCVVRVLLRGLPASSGAEKHIEGHTVLVNGPAKEASWPGVALCDGDLDGVIWTSSHDSGAVIAVLRANPCVVVAISD